jgi:mannose-6-phosphate isomerase-like protein (cupin superfamily)
MELVRCWEEEGVTIPEPYHRNLKIFFAPDKLGVREISFQQAIIFPGGKTDYHKHDRPELIYVVEGEGKSVCEGVETSVEKDVVIWVPAGEMHQIINTGDENIKLATVFIPGYEAKELYASRLKAAEEARGDKE